MPDCPGLLRLRRGTAKRPDTQTGARGSIRIFLEHRVDAAWDLVKNWTAEERQKLRDDVPKLGFAARIAGRDVLHLARATMVLAEKGLARRRRLDAGGQDETRYLRPIQEYVARGITPAEELLAKFLGAWDRSVDLVFKEYAY